MQLHIPVTHPCAWSSACCHGRVAVFCYLLSPAEMAAPDMLLPGSAGRAVCPQLAGRSVQVAGMMFTLWVTALEA